MPPAEARHQQRLPVPPAEVRHQRLLVLPAEARHQRRSQALPAAGWPGLPRRPAAAAAVAVGGLRLQPQPVQPPEQLRHLPQRRPPPQR